MFIFNIASPGYAIAFLLLTICVIILGKETKRSIIPALLLFFYLVLIIMHIIQLITLRPEYNYLFTQLKYCLICDFIFILISYISYIYIDDIEAKYRNKKVIENNIKGFWKKI